MNETSPLKILWDTLPQTGSVEWIGIRPARNEPVVTLESVQVDFDKGLVGDWFNGKSDNLRQVTLIQFEHLPVIASCLGIDKVEPALVRRNIAVSGLNLLALKDKTFQVGDAILEYTGLCHPCSKMERLLGPGGYNAMRGHGGITARVLKSGVVSVNSKIFYENCE